MEKLRELGKDIWWLTSYTVKKLYWWGGEQRCQGILFISHLGEIYSSGFRQISAGNVRRDPVVKIYHNSVLFKSLPDPDELKGQCGECPFNVIAGDIGHAPTASRATILPLSLSVFSNLLQRKDPNVIKSLALARNLSLVSECDAPYSFQRNPTSVGYPTDSATHRKLCHI